MRQRAPASVDVGDDAQWPPRGHPHVSRLNRDHDRAWQEAQARHLQHVRRKRSREDERDKQRGRAKHGLNGGAPQRAWKHDLGSIERTKARDRPSDDHRRKSIGALGLSTIEIGSRYEGVVELRNALLDKSSDAQVVRAPPMRPNQ